jgi:hypothetical protein
MNTSDWLLEDARRHEPIAVAGAIKYAFPSRGIRHAVVVDKDDTVSTKGWWRNDSERVKTAREAFFTKLAQRNIPTLMWSRNWSVHAFQKDLEKSLGIKLLPAITFENWPFFQQETAELAFDPAALQRAINSIPTRLHDVIIQYVQENFNEEVGRPFEYYAEVLRRKIEDFMMGHFITWREKEHGDWDDKSLSGLACENLLEAKVPMFIGLSQTQFSSALRADFIRNGVLVNDQVFPLESMKIFGYNFIHVGWVPQVDRAVDIIELVKET